MRIGYREQTKSFPGATISTDQASRDLREEIEKNGPTAIFSYPENGLPEIEFKPARRSQ